MADHHVLLLGLGFWGSNWMRVLRNAENCDLAGIAGSVEDIDRLSKEYDLSACRVYTDYREAIDKTDADIVIIAIPTKFHTDAAKLALARGVNVLSEKPLASSMAEAEDILAFRKGFPKLKYMVDQNYRWRPHNQTMKKALEDGMIGEIGTVHIEFRQPEDLLGYREFLEMPLLQDVSIHHFDLIRFFTGRRCEKIFGHSFRPTWSKFEGEPATEAVICLEGGIVASYSGTWAARGKVTSWDGDITITGDKGCLVLDVTSTVRFLGVGDTEGTVLESFRMERTELDYALDMFARCIDEDLTPESALEDNYHSFSMVSAYASGGHYAAV